MELNGGRHADSEHDRVRDTWLTAQGYRILRFWNVEIVNNNAGVLDTILAELPPFLRRRGEGRDDPVVGAASPRGEGEGAASAKTQPEPHPHPRLPPRCDDDGVVASLFPPVGRGEIQE